MPKVTGVTCSFTKACVFSGPRLRMPGTASHFCPTHMQAVTSSAPIAAVDFETPLPSHTGQTSFQRQHWAVQRGIIGK